MRARPIGFWLAPLCVLANVCGALAATPAQQFTDTDGDAYSVTLAGPGSVVVDQGPGDGPIRGLALTGTTAGSVLTVRLVTKVADGVVTIGAVTGAGSLQSLNAKTSDLTGAGVALGGGLGTVTLRDIADGANISAGVDAKLKTTKLTAARIGAATIQTGAKNFALTAQQIGGAKFKAGAVTSFKVTAGNAVADVDATGKLVALSVTGGDFTGHVRAAAIGSIRIAKSRAGAGGSITNSFIAAKSIGPVIVDGSITGSYLMAGADFGADREPGGTGLNADTFAAGSLKSVLVKGNLADSVIGAGLHPVDTAFGDLNDGTLGGKLSRLTSFTIKGQITGKSVVGAGLLPVFVSVNKVRFKPLLDLRFVSRKVREARAAQVVAPPLDPTATAPAATGAGFLFGGNDPLQTGVAAGTIEMKRMAVLRGRTINRDGVAAPGVTIAVFDHPEFGQTFSREDGQFDLAVNGGGLLTLKFAAAGLMTAHRQIDAAQLDFNNVGDVAMVGADPNATDISFGPTEPMQVHEASFQTDAEGSRHVVAIFQPGTSATMILPDGTPQPIAPGGTLRVRATEFTVGPNGERAMPAQLPPNSAYTFCVEFGADEAVNANAPRVNFDKTVFTFVENFLGFPTGTIVPNGTFNRLEGRWVAEGNGLVIKIVGETGGMADLDVTGDGAADTGAPLTALGITDAERTQLAASYAGNPSLWRVPITHFTFPFDWNFGYGAASSASEPTTTPQSDRPPDKPDDPPNVYIQPQVLGERLPITGTPFTLNYRSNRVAGRTAARRLSIPITQAAPPPDLRGVGLKIEVAGRVFFQEFPPAPNQIHEFEWDGRDAYGRLVPGRQPVKVTLSYLYDLVYTGTAAFARNGDGTPIPGVVGRRQVALSKTSTLIIGDFDFRRLSIGGWTLSAHHTYDPLGQILHLGDGTERSAQGVSKSITTVAGGGTLFGPAADGHLATEADLRIFNGGDVAFAADGSMFISETPGGGGRIRKVAPDGIISTIAGAGTFGQTGDGGPAIDATFDRPQGLAFGPDGSLYIVDSLAGLIRKIAANASGQVTVNSIITTVAGGGASFQDNVPATQSQLRQDQHPTGYGIAVGADGSIYIPDGYHFCVRKVGTDGIITTVAGAGINANPPNLGDGGPATQARVIDPTGVALDPQGNLYISEAGHVRKVTPDGIIHTVAGAYSGGSYAEGIPATQALVDARDLVAFADGSFTFVEGSNDPNLNYRARHVDAQGIIRTIAGIGGTPGFDGDGGLPRQAHLSICNMLGISRDGRLHVVDHGNTRVRAIGSTLPGFTAAHLEIPSEDGRELYRFDEFGRHLTTHDTFTGTAIHTFGYDTDGQLASITDADGNVTKITRTAGGAPTAITAPFGQKTTLTTDASGMLASLRDPAGGTHTFTNTADGLLTSTTDPAGSTHTYQYDSSGRLLKADWQGAPMSTLARTDLPLGYSVELSDALRSEGTFKIETLANSDELRTNTDAAGLVTTDRRRESGVHTRTEPTGMVRTTTFNADPRFGMRAPFITARTVAAPSGKAQTFSATRTATLTEAADPLTLAGFQETYTLNGRTFARTFNPATKTFDRVSPEGRHLLQTLDARGRLVSAKPGDLAELQFTFDAKGRRLASIRTAGALERRITFAYDAGSRLAKITDPLARITTFTRDAAGRLTRSVLPGARTVNFGYDAKGRLTALTPPGRPAHQLAYTSFDALLRHTAPDAGGGASTTDFEYAADAQLSKITRPTGDTVAYAYDSAGRLATLIVAAGATTFSRDAQGRLATITSPDATVARSFDGDILLGETWTGAVAGSVTRTIDQDFRAASRTVTSGASTSTTAFTYDDDSLVTDAGPMTLTRDASGLVTAITIGTLVEALAYNGFGELISHSAQRNGATIFAQEHTRDALGRITETVGTIGGTTDTYSYSYDAAGGLAETQKNGVITATYTYDANGNRLTAAGLAATYDAQDRLLTRDAVTYVHNDAGDLVSATDGAARNNQFTYDALGNLRSATISATTITYRVDGMDRRVARLEGGDTTRYLYQDALRIAGVIEPSGQLASFVYAQGRHVPDYMVKGGATYRLLTDPNGSVRLVVNTADGSVAQRLDYDAFGQIALDTLPEFQPFAFAGGLYDAQTNVLRFGARDYDPETGRWTTKDPILFEGGDTNLYAYVANDPVNRRDPSGLFSGSETVNILDPVTGTYIDYNPDRDDLSRDQRDRLDYLRDQKDKGERLTSFQEAELKRLEDRQSREIEAEGERESETENEMNDV